MKSFHALVAAVNRRQRLFRVTTISLNELRKTLEVHAIPLAKPPFYLFTDASKKRWTNKRGQFLLNVIAGEMRGNPAYRKVKSIGVIYHAQ